MSHKTIGCQVNRGEVKFSFHTKNEYELKTREEMLDTGENADVTFVVGKGADQKQFNVHRFILKIGSQKFRDLLEANEGKAVIELPNVNPADFDILLRVIYLQRFDLESINSIYAIAKLFEEYGLQSAARECYENTNENITTESAISIYEATDESPDNVDIILGCIYVFQTHTRDILASESFCNAKPETVVKIFEQPELCISSELDLLVALECYAGVNNALPEHVGGNRDRFCDLVQPALCHIRFYTLTPHQLLKCTAAKTLLSKEEFLGVIANLVTIENPIYEYPKDFSHSVVNRAMIYVSDLSHSTNSSGIGATEYQSVPHENYIMYGQTPTLVANGVAGEQKGSKQATNQKAITPDEDKLWL